MHRRASVGRGLPMSFGVAALLAIACGGFGRGTRPDAMSAEAHRSKAGEHAREAREHGEQYDPDATTSGGRYGPPTSYGRRDFYWTSRQYNPTARHLTQAKEQERHAREHLEAARVLEGFEEAQCVSFPPETRVACPLFGHVESVEDIFDGVRIRLDEGVDMNAVVAHMRCHLAFARARGRIGMDACPLYLPGIQVERVGISRSVDLVTSDRGILDALRERTRAHLAPNPHG